MLLKNLGRRGQDERGTVLVIVAITLVAFLGLGALAIDIGSFYQAQRQAQLAADAGALAASQDLGSGKATNATSDGTTLAQTNFPGATVHVTTSANQATVNVSAVTPSFFGKFLGLTSENIGARAVAATTPGATACTSPGSTCYAYFAMDSNCSNHGISISGGNSTINGGTYTNAGFYVNGGVNNFKGPVNYGTGCSSQTVGGVNTFNGGAPAATPSDIMTWPIDYAADFPACSGSACTGPLGTPSYCTYATAGSYTFSATISPTNSGSTQNGVYCAVGTGTASTPTTWNGSITLSGGIGSATVTFIAGSVTLSGGIYTLTPASNNLLAYATNGTATLSGGNDNWTGDIFVPAGTATISGGNTSETTMVEAQDIVLNGGNITGDGPTDSGTTTSSSGTSALIQ
jgi:Flp pilus assembly protein TadG